jgi:hypothetical protein
MDFAIFAALLLYLTVVVIVIVPLRFVERYLGTTLATSLIHITKRIGNL